MTKQEKELIEQFAVKHGLAIERYEGDRAILDRESQRKTEAECIKCVMEEEKDDAWVSVRKKDGNYHSRCCPAWEHYRNGATVTTGWAQNGLWHREDGPALINDDGTEIWLENGQVHREDGPALTEADGTEIWYYQDRIHRDDGLPAVIRPDGTREYWVNGVQIRV
jgi:hypothetical protein